jgi:hypothetical protein
MSELNNGESLSRVRRFMPKRHNAKLCPFAIRQRIVNALANGDSIRAIARALQVSNNTVVAIRDQDWQQVAARKERIASQAELGATEAGDRLIDAIRSGVISGQGLIPAFGVCVDKMVALRGDVTQTIRHLHSVDLSEDDLVAFAVSRSKSKHDKTVIHDNPVILEVRAPVTERIASAKVRELKGGPARKRKAGRTKSSNPSVDNERLTSLHNDDA